MDDTILMIVAKAITQRQRPTDIPVNEKYSDTFFKSGSGPLGKGSSFPSGHALMAFSVATIFAHRYREHRWIPYLAYGFAAAISFLASRPGHTSLRTFGSARQPDSRLRASAFCTGNNLSALELARVRSC